VAAPVWLARTRAAFWTTCWPALKRDGESFGADKGDRKRLSTIIRTWVTNKALAVELRRGRDPSRARIRGSGPWSGDAAAEDSGFEVGVGVP
jgi:hypothetical protein